MEFTNLIDPFDIYIPWSFDHHGSINREFLSCGWWDESYFVNKSIIVTKKVNSSEFDDATLLN